MGFPEKLIKGHELHGYQVEYHFEILELGNFEIGAERFDAKQISQFPNFTFPN